MNFTVAARYLCTMAALGAVSNYVVYPLAPREAGILETVWRDIEVLGQDSIRGNQSGLSSFLHHNVTDQSEATKMQSRDSDGGSSQFIYGGKVYRLSGLVTGMEPAATLIGDSGEARRLVPGDRLPGGEKILSIRINHIEIEDNGGSVVTSEIYKR